MLVTPVRVAALGLMIIAAFGVGWLVTSDEFSLATNGVEINGVHYTDPTLVSGALHLSPAGGPNVFSLDTQGMRRSLQALPGVATADVEVALPNRLVVNVTEHTPVLQVIYAPHFIDPVVYLIDAQGVVLDSRLDGSVAPDLPEINDQRAQLGPSYAVGGEIDPTESAAMLQIGALTPALVGSSATALDFSANDTDGFVVSSGADGWRAVFGFYTATLRPPTMIAQQVQCLRSLLATGESTIGTIYLAPSDGRCGTYLPRPSPSPA